MNSRIQFLQESLRDQEKEADVHHRLITKKLQSIFELQKQQHELKQSLDGVEQEIEKKRAEIATLQTGIQRVHAEVEVYKVYNYEDEYTARRNYYKSFLTVDDQESVQELEQLLAGNSRPLLVSPETHFACKKRVAELFSLAAESGFFCIECVPLKPGEELRIEEVAPNYFQINMEGYLLPVLKGRRVTILSTWVLQKAWYDFLSLATIWYDLCGEADVLFRNDAGMVAEHWARLEQAESVTYAGEAYQKLTYHRRDARLLSADAEESEEATDLQFLERMAAKALTPEGRASR